MLGFSACDDSPEYDDSADDTVGIESVHISLKDLEYDSNYPAYNAYTIDFDSEYQAIVTINPTDVSISHIEFHTDNGSVITVSGGGIVRGVGGGEAVLYVDVYDANGKITQGSVVIFVNSHYSVGDYYPYDSETPLGVVFWTDGEHGKIVGFDEIEVDYWGDDNVELSLSHYNGLYNMAIVQEEESSFANFPAFKAVDQLNSSGAYKSGETNLWYLPADAELRQLIAAMVGLKWVDSNGSADIMGLISNGTFTDWYNYTESTDYFPYETFYADDTYSSNTAWFDKIITDKGGVALMEGGEYWSSTSGTSDISSYAYIVLCSEFNTSLMDKDSGGVKVRPIMAF